MSTPISSLAMRRSGQEVAAAALATYGDRMYDYVNDQPSEQPISASEVDEASSLIFRRAAPSEYVFSPSASSSVTTEQGEHHPNNSGGGRNFPTLRRNQSLGGEVLAMGHRLARHPGVQAIIMEDISQHYQGPDRGGANALPPAFGGHERGLARLVDMLDPDDDELMRVRDFSTDEDHTSADILRNSRRHGISGGTTAATGRNSSRQDDAEQQLDNLSPGFSQDWHGVIQAATDPWPTTSDDGEEKEEVLEASDPRCSCRVCHEAPEREPVASDASCWNELLKDYECGICFDVLVGVHVLDNCGHHFCGGCMERWMGNTPQGECPVCREPVNKLVPVRILDQVVEKAVEAAAPGRERSAWLQRHDDWARNARRRQEAADRAKAAQEAAAVGEIAPQAGAPRTAYQRGSSAARNWTDRRRQQRHREEDRHWQQQQQQQREGNASGNNRNNNGWNGFRGMSTLETVVAVAVAIVVVALGIRRSR